MHIQLKKLSVELYMTFNHGFLISLIGGAPWYRGLLIFIAIGSCLASLSSSYILSKIRCFNLLRIISIQAEVAKLHVCNTYKVDDSQ